jgi:hypothetical protein
MTTKRTVYVRPNFPMTIECGGHTYFGSGCGGVSLALSDGAKRGPSFPGGENGFFAWTVCDVTLPPGESAHLREWHHPGGTRDIRVIADLENWRVQRRASLMAYFRRCAEERALAAKEQARERAIVGALNEALAEYDAACARHGQRAMRDRRRWAIALASTYLVEVIRRCNRHLDDPTYGLESRTRRWEELPHIDPRIIPPGTTRAFDWVRLS